MMSLSLEGEVVSPKFNLPPTSTNQVQMPTYTRAWYPISTSMLSKKSGTLSSLDQIRQASTPNLLHLGGKWSQTKLLREDKESSILMIKARVQSQISKTSPNDFRIYVFSIYN